MRKKIILLLAIAISFSVSAQEQIPELPIDPAVKVGKLENGLTYYIRHNEEPKGQANFYIAQKVGSILEEEDQRGLAHFLEHMCFNGTEHFPGNDLIKYCERIGVKFGADLNAYTSIDETVYNIDNVPISKYPSSIDSCLLILHDWADGLLLKDEDIDHERGVIHEEWRSRSSASMRMYETLLPEIYPNNRYGQRLPIGLMSVVDNFPYKALRDYYEKWYRPDQQGIIVVGDFDVELMENKIKEIFGTIQKPENPAERVYFQVEDNEEPIIAIAKDKEQPYVMSSIFLKHDPYPVEQRSKVPYYMYCYAVNAIHSMLSARIQEILQNPTPPFIQGSISDNEFFVSKTKYSFNGTAVSSEADFEKAFTTIYREMLRAIRNGFTESEYDRAVIQMQTYIESSYNQREKRKSGSFCKEYVRHFIDNEPIMGIENEYAIISEKCLVPLEAVNQIVASFAGKGNLVAMLMFPEKDGATYPTAEKIKSLLKSVEDEDIPPYVDKVVDKELLPAPPQPGKITKKDDAPFGYKKLTLSNGTVVYLKKTDFNKDQIIMNASSFGGTSLYTPSNELKAVDDVIQIGGAGQFSAIDLKKALTGKKVGVSLSIGRTGESISASSTPKDIETMFQLNYLYLTQPRADEEAFASWKSRTIDVIKNRNADPTSALVDSIDAIIHVNSTRFTELTVDDVQNLDYARMMEIAKERFSNAKDFTFYITGNFNEETIEPMIEKYIGSLPSVNKKEKAETRVLELRKGHINSQFETKMETPTVNNIFFDNGKIKYTLKNNIAYNLAMQTLRIIFTEEIREKEGGTYGVSCGGSNSGYPTNVAQMQIFYQTSPEKYENLNSKIRKIVADFAKTGPSEENLLKGKEYLKKKYQESLRENSFYESSLRDLLINHVNNIDDYEAVVDSITKDDIIKVFSSLQKQSNHIEIIQVGIK